MILLDLDKLARSFFKKMDESKEEFVERVALEIVNNKIDAF